MENPKQYMRSRDRCVFVLAQCLLTGKTPAADLTSLNPAEPGRCSISNTEKEPPKHSS